MKAMLVFQLPEDQNEFDHASKGSEAISCLNAIDRLIHDTLKYDEKITEVERTLLEKVRDELPRWLWDLE